MEAPAELLWLVDPAATRLLRAGMSWDDVVAVLGWRLNPPEATPLPGPVGSVVLPLRVERAPQAGGGRQGLRTETETITMSEIIPAGGRP